MPNVLTTDTWIDEIVVTAQVIRIDVNAGSSGSFGGIAFSGAGTYSGTAGGLKTALIVKEKTQNKDSVLDSVIKCGADQLGISNLIQADLVRRGLPEAGSKRFVTKGSSPGTSQLSRTLSKRFPQKIPGGGRIWTPDPSFSYTLKPSDLARLGRMSSTVGRAVGRLIPVVSAGLLIYDLTATGICVAKERSGD